MSFQGIMTLLFLGFLAFIGFFIYFVFKILQFVLQATNLYKDMITRQDMMIKLLQEIRQGGKLIKEPEGLPKTTVCKKCGKQYDEDLKGQYCEECGAKLS